MSRSRMRDLRGSASAPAAEPEGVPEINPVDKEEAGRLKNFLRRKKTFFPQPPAQHLDAAC